MVALSGVEHDGRSSLSGFLVPVACAAPASWLGDHGALCCSPVQPALWRSGIPEEAQHSPQSLSSETKGSETHKMIKETVQRIS